MRGGAGAASLDYAPVDAASTSLPGRGLAPARRVGRSRHLPRAPGLERLLGRAPHAPEPRARDLPRGRRARGCIPLSASARRAPRARPGTPPRSPARHPRRRHRRAEPRSRRRARAHRAARAESARELRLHAGGRARSRALARTARHRPRAGNRRRALLPRLRAARSPGAAAPRPRDRAGRRPLRGLPRRAGLCGVDGGARPLPRVRSPPGRQHARRHRLPRGEQPPRRRDHRGLVAARGRQRGIDGPRLRPGGRLPLGGGSPRGFGRAARIARRRSRGGGARGALADAASCRSPARARLCPARRLRAGCRAETSARQGWSAGAMGHTVPVLLLDDGELDDVQECLEELGVSFGRVRGGAIVSQTPAPARLLVSTPRRIDAVELPPAGSDAAKGLVRIVVVSEDSTTLRERLRRDGFDYLVRRPVHPEALRLLLMRSLYAGEERRGEERVPMGIEVSFRTGLLPRRATMVDLSSRGCRLLSSYALEPGRRVSVQVPDSRKEPLVVRGQVVRISLDEHLGPDGPYCAAVAFEAMPEGDRERLAALLAKRSVGAATLVGTAGDDGLVPPEARAADLRRVEFPVDVRVAPESALPKPGDVVDHTPAPQAGGDGDGERRRSPRRVD